MKNIGSAAPKSARDGISEVDKYNPVLMSQESIRLAKVLLQYLTSLNPITPVTPGIQTSLLLLPSHVYTTHRSAEANNSCS